MQTVGMSTSSTSSFSSGDACTREDAAARINERAFRFPDQLRGATDLTGMAFGENLVAGEMDRIDRNVMAASLENVLRDIDQHGTGAAAGGEIESFVHDARQFGEHCAP